MGSNSGEHAIRFTVKDAEKNQKNDRSVSTTGTKIRPCPKFLYPLPESNKFNNQALMEYTPKVYPGRITLFRALAEPDDESCLLSLSGGGLDVLMFLENMIQWFVDSMPKL